jgi:membrane protein DedA with SNARE-associated domain
MKPAQPHSASPVSYILRIVGLVLVLGITLAIAANRNRIQDFATLGYIGAFLAMLLSNATLILPAPGLIIVFALGSSLNPVVVGLSGALGASLGELTGYLTGVSGVAIMENTPIAHRIKRWMNHNGVLTIFALSTVPNPFFDIAGLMAGAAKMPVWKFLGSAFCGKSIQAIVIAFAGALSLHWVEPWLTH